MEVRIDKGAFETSKTTNLDLFTQQCAFFFDEFAQRVAVVVSGKQVFHVGCTGRHSGGDYPVAKLNESIRAGDEVSFEVDPDHNADAGFDSGSDATFNSSPVVSALGTVQAVDTN